jgi:hypothetical protein
MRSGHTFGTSIRDEFGTRFGTLIRDRDSGQDSGLFKILLILHQHGVLILHQHEVLILHQHEVLILHQHFGHLCVCVEDEI